MCFALVKHEDICMCGQRDPLHDMVQDPIIRPSQTSASQGVCPINGAIMGHLKLSQKSGDCVPFLWSAQTSRFSKPYCGLASNQELGWGGNSLLGELYSFLYLKLPHSQHETSFKNKPTFFLDWIWQNYKFDIVCLFCDYDFL